MHYASAITAAVFSNKKYPLKPPHDKKLIFAKQCDLLLNRWPIHWNDLQVFFSRLLKNVFEAVDTRQKQVKKLSLCVTNENFEPVFNTASATQIVFQRVGKTIYIAGSLTERPLHVVLATRAVITLTISYPLHKTTDQLSNFMTMGF